MNIIYRDGWIVDGRRVAWVALEGAEVDPADTLALDHAVAGCEYGRITIGR